MICFFEEGGALPKRRYNDSITRFLAQKYQKITVARMGFGVMLAGNVRGHFMPGTCLLNFLRYCFHHGFNQS